RRGPGPPGPHERGRGALREDRPDDPESRVHERARPHPRAERPRRRGQALRRGRPPKRRALRALSRGRLRPSQPRPPLPPHTPNLHHRNCELRRNGESNLLRARSYLQAERRAEAKKLLDEIAATPWTTPELAEVRRQAGG